MTTRRLLHRRAAIAEMGKAGLAIVVFGTAACSDGAGSGTSTTPAPTTPSTTAGPTTSPTTVADATTTIPASTSSTAAGGATSFQRVELDFVSAYILYRNGEAALVDTGVEGSADAIEAALAEAGLEWGSVGHVILTHKHPDHVGSVDAVMERAGGATLYAGEADIPQIASDTPPQAVGDGEMVFDLQVVHTPGHTPGHICVLDEAAGILVAGDAIVGSNGTVAGPDPSFAEDIDVALESVRKLAGFTYEVALFGHGEPVLQGASEAVAALADA